MNQKDPSIIKILRRKKNSELLRRSAFTTPTKFATPRTLLREGKINVCNSQENGVRTRRAAIANHSPDLLFLGVYKSQGKPPKTPRILAPSEPHKTSRKTEKNCEKHSKHQGMSLVRKDQGKSKRQGKEGQGVR